MRSYRFAFALLSTLLCWNVTAVTHAQTKIAVVDLQRALNETEDGRQAQRRLKKLFEKRQKSLDATQEKLKKQKESIEKQQDVLSQDALRKKVEAYQQELVKLQQEYVEYQQELAAKEAELTKVILEKMQRILRRIGQTDGYTLIMESNEGGVVWVPSNLDLTDTLIQRYNAQAKKAGSGTKSKK